MADSPKPLSEAIPHYAGKMSDAQKIAMLRKALEEMLPEFPRDPINLCYPTFSQCENARTALQATDQ